LATLKGILEYSWEHFPLLLEKLENLYGTMILIRFETKKVLPIFFFKKIGL
jgi:hypothetical protein